jgi:SAM-dependent methyltransferase
MAKKFVEEYGLAEDKVVVDVGAKDYNGTYRQLFPGSKYVGADIEPGANVDVIVGAAEWDKLKNVDAVISGNTFEHVEDEAMLLAKIHAILKPGGMLWVSAPSVGPQHGAPTWFRYYTEESLSGVIRDAGFAVLSCETDPHPEFMFVTCIARKGPELNLKKLIGLAYTTNELLEDAAALEDMIGKAKK